MNRRIIGREIIADIRAGMRESRLMKKYSLSSRDLRAVYRQIKLERASRIAEIAADLTKGLSQTYVMNKHQISASALSKVIKKMSADQIAQFTDLSKELSEPSDDVMIDFRKKERFKPTVKILCWDRKSAVGECSLRDISEDGLAMVGSQARVKEIVQIAILGDETGTVIPFELEAECKWSIVDNELGKPVAGFRITRISSGDRDRLVELLENHTDHR